jgi:hypothetical protein
MLINLSNHPSVNWMPEQITTAQSFGKIVDIPFPAIPPDWDTEKVILMAHEYLDKCKQLLNSKNETSAVHLAGEPIFCFVLAQLLLKENITCLASTTERIVTEKNGIKTSEFRFRCFRKYKLLD